MNEELMKGLSDRLLTFTDSEGNAFELSESEIVEMYEKSLQPTTTSKEENNFIKNLYYSLSQRILCSEKNDRKYLIALKGEIKEYLQALQPQVSEEEKEREEARQWWLKQPIEYRQAFIDNYRKETKKPQVSEDVEEDYVSEVSLQVLDTEIVYVIELANNVWFTGTFKESKELDTHRTRGINCASIYRQEETAQIVCENIINAGKFKNAKVVPYCLKPKTKFAQMEQDLRVEQDNYLRVCEFGNELAKENNQYKQLLDEIEKELYIERPMSIRLSNVKNILKQLKELGDK